MTSFAFNTFSTTAQSLVGGETGYIGPAGALYVAAADAISATGNTEMTILGSVTAATADVIDLSAGLSLDLHIGPAAYLNATSESVVEADYQGSLYISNAGGMVSQGETIIANTTDGSSAFRLINGGHIESFNQSAIVLSLGTGGAVINNSGTIQGFLTQVINISAASVDITNSGQIEARDTTSIAIRLNVSTGAAIVNSGTIQGHVIVDGGETSIVNTGTIMGLVETGSANDTIDTTYGTVTGIIIGGLGNDTYKLGAAGATIVELDTEGFDTVESTHSHALAANIESLILTGSGDTHGSGNAQFNVMTGNAGDNRLFGYGGNDIFYGGDGDDLMAGGAGDDTFVIVFGNDTIRGGNGRDGIFLDDAGDVMIDLAAGTGTNSAGDILTIQGVEDFGTDLGNDILTGNAQDNELSGGAGNDTVSGGDGNDTLTGSSGRDVLTGGLGADVFIYASASHSQPLTLRDRIEDFTRGEDVIDLSIIDAITFGSDDAFTFVGGGSLTGGAGRLRFQKYAANDVTIISGDVNGDGVADFQIELAGQKNLTASDFIL